MARPIIVIHKGVSVPLLYTLMQAFHSNPRSEVYWITDDESTTVSYASKIPLAGLMSEAEHFSEIYNHQSENTYEFELFCFQRWFILNEFMSRYGVSSCLALDSDVLLYSRIDEMENALGAFEMTISRDGSPHCALINSVQIVKELCSEISETFRALNRSREKLNQNLSDMTVLDNFARKNPDRIIYSNTIRNGTTIDHNMQCPDGFIMKDERKKILWKERMPYGMLDNSDEKVKFHALHFQGSGKVIIGDYYNQLKS